MGDGIIDLAMLGQLPVNFLNKDKDDVRIRFNAGEGKEERKFLDTLAGWGKLEKWGPYADDSVTYGTLSDNAAHREFFNAAKPVAEARLQAAIEKAADLPWDVAGGWQKGEALVMDSRLLTPEQEKMVTALIHGGEASAVTVGNEITYYLSQRTHPLFEKLLPQAQAKEPTLREDLIRQYDWERDGIYNGASRFEVTPKTRDEGYKVLIRANTTHLVDRGTGNRVYVRSPDLLDAIERAAEGRGGKGNNR